MPLHAGRSGHSGDSDHLALIGVMRQPQQRADTRRVVGGRPGERRDVLGRRDLGQGGELGGVLPGELPCDRLGGRPGRHQPGQPAVGGVVEVLMVIVGDAAHMTGQIGGAPFRAWRRRIPGGRREPRRDRQDRAHTVVVGDGRVRLSVGKHCRGKRHRPVPGIAKFHGYLPDRAAAPRPNRRAWPDCQKDRFARQPCATGKQSDSERGAQLRSGEWLSRML
jgi:hypothetical protein